MEKCKASCIIIDSLCTSQNRSWKIFITKIMPKTLTNLSKVASTLYLIYTWANADILNGKFLIYA